MRLGVTENSMAKSGYLIFSFTAAIFYRVRARSIPSSATVRVFGRINCMVVKVNPGQGRERHVPMKPMTLPTSSLPMSPSRHLCLH